MAYYVLSSYYYPLTNWLSPIAGGGLSLMLGLFFIMLGNPLIYPVLIPVWIVIGAIIGLSVRRVLGSIVSSIFVFLTCWGIISIGFVGYLFSFLSAITGTTAPGTGLGSFSSLTLFSAAPPPIGSNILTLITEPVIYQFFEDIMANIPSLAGTTQGLAGSTSPTSAISSLFLKFVAPFIISSIMLFIICTVTASLVAHYLPRIFRERGGRQSARNRRAMARVFTLLALIVVVMIVLSSFVPGIAGTQIGSSGIRGQHGRLQASTLEGSQILRSAVAQMSAVERFDSAAHSVAVDHQISSTQHGMAKSLASAGYNESAFNLISPYGNLYSLYSFDSTGTIPQASVTGNSQVMASYLLMTNNLIDLPFTDVLSSMLGTANSSQSGSSTIALPSLSSLLNLVPPEMLVILVNSGPINAKTVAAQQAQYYSGVTGDQFTLIFGITNSTSANGSSSLSSTGFLAGSNVFVYGSNAPAPGSAAHMAGSYLSKLHPDGLISAFSGGLTSGSLFAAPSGGFVSSIMMAGYQSGSAFPVNSSTNVSLVPSPLSGSSFFYGLFVKYAFAHGSGQHVIPLSSIAGNHQFSFSPTASNSSFELLYPNTYNAFNLTTFASQNGGYDGIVYSDYPQVGNITYNSSGWTYINVNSGYVFDPSTGITFSAPFPPDLILTSTSSVAGDSIRIAAALVNEGNSTVSGVSLHFPGAYILASNQSVVTAGSGYTNVSTLAPGQSLDTTFTFTVGNGGVYMLPPIQYSFSDGQHSFFLISAWQHAKVQDPLVFALFPSYLAKAGYGLSTYLHLHMSYDTTLYIIYALLSLFMFLAVYSQYSSYRKWSAKRRRLMPAQRGTRGVPPPKQPEQREEEYPSPESKNE